MTTQPVTDPELCLNIWWFVIGDSNVVTQWAVRGYMLDGTDEEKLRVLQQLSRHDFATVQWQQIPQRFVVVIPSVGELAGATTLELIRFDQGFYESVILPHLDRTLTHRNTVRTTDKVFPKSELRPKPMQCDTVVHQTMQGQLIPQVKKT